MKPKFAAFLAFAALAAAPLAAAAPADASPKPATRVADLRGRFNLLVDELAKKAAARSATREDFARVVEEIRSVANDYIGARRVETIRDRFIRRMNDLEARAQTAALQLQELDVLKDIMVDLELEGAMHRMADRARAGQATRLEYAMVYEALSQRAEYAKDWDPELEAIVGRLRAECERLEQRGREAIAAKDLVPVQEMHADLMCHAVRARLGKRAMKPAPGVLVPQDYTDVIDTLVDYGVPATSDLARKVNGRLEEIKSAVAGGRVTRADFDALRDLLMQRARAASTPG